MSGYLEVKYPFKSNLGLNPFKSWKKQWCILRPCSTYVGGGSLAVYCSEAGTPAGTIELRSGCIVKRAKSRSRPHAFAVFSVEDLNKPRILLAAQTTQEAQIWMDKIRSLINGEKLLGTETLLKDSYTVTIIPTPLSHQCELTQTCNVTLSSNGIIIIEKTRLTILWQHIKHVHQTRENGSQHKCCVIHVDSAFHGGGDLKFSTPTATELVNAIKQALRVTTGLKKLSRSDGDLSMSKNDGDIRRGGWYSGPSEVSLDDTDLIMSKGVASGRLSRCGAPIDRRLHLASFTSLANTEICAERRSLVSVASGVYEEIAEVRAEGEGEAEPAVQAERVESPAQAELRERAERLLGWSAEPMYESVADCVYATMRRTRPPPLPPRHPAGTLKLGEWSCSLKREGTCAGPDLVGGAEAGVTRHCSLGSLHRCSKTPRPRQPFSVFRKRLKSDSRVMTSPKPDSPKEKDVEPKKKRFDFTPTKDIFKNFRVGRKMKNLKITNSNLVKSETKSCEFLDETHHVTTNRCSKSVECLEENDEFEEFVTDLSLVADKSSVTGMALPQELVQLILHGRDLTKVRFKEGEIESEYMPMSPIVPQTPIDHYIVMSPRTNLA